MKDSYKGQVFGRLKVERTLIDLDGREFFYCRCSCGANKLVRAYNVLRGSTRSCGCLRNETTANINAKINADIAAEIIRLRASGLSYGKIAARVDMSRSAVYYFCAKHQQEIDEYINVWDFDKSSVMKEGE